MQKTLTNIGIAVLGQENVGKSTLISRLIWRCKGVDKQLVEKLIMHSENPHQDKFQSIIGRSISEREIGNTQDVHYYKMETSKYKALLFDTPGLIKYQKNMITGISQAEVAILVVSADEGEFKAGFVNTNSQTKNCALLAYTLALKQIIVVINKMDIKGVYWDQEKFDNISKEMTGFIRKIGYNADKVAIIPISAFNEDNLIERSSNALWYKGPTLIEAIDALPPPIKYVNKPLRISVHRVEKIGGVGTVAIGKVVTGRLKTGAIVRFALSNISCEVRSIESYHSDMQEAISGDYVGFCLKSVTKAQIKRGEVCGEDKNDPPLKALSFEAQVIMLDLPGKLQVGYTPIFDFHSAHVPGKFVELISKIDKRSGKVIETSPKFIIAGEAAIVKIVPEKPICVEAFSVYPSLGRFSVRDNNRVVIVGVVKSVEKDIGVHKETTKTESETLQ